MPQSANILDEVERVINRALMAPADDAIDLALDELIGRVTNRSDKNQAKASRHLAQQAAIQKLYLAGISKVMAHAETQMLQKLHKGSSKVKNTDPAAVDFMFDLNAFSKMFQAQMREAGEEALQISGQGLLSELGIPQRYITPHGIIHDFTIERQNRLASVPSEIYDTLKSSLEEGIQQGETMDDLGKRVQATVGKIDAGRAQTIARTETSSAYNTARLDAMKQHGFTYKSWLTAEDERVRVSHEMAEADGAIPMDQKFSNGLDHPGDPIGSAAEVINCRCVLQPAEAPDV